MRRRLFQIIIPVIIVAIPSLGASALNYGSGTYGSCQYGSCSITLTSNGLVSLNVTPSPSGSCTTQSDTVSVLTDDSNGYSLTLADNSTNTSLTYGSSSIATTSGTFSSPIALTVDKWGYRVDGAGGFGSGPTTAQSNVPLNSTTFAGVQPSNATPDTIANTSAAADPAVNTPVWYGVCADLSVTPGAYTTVVTYTAITN